MLEGRARGELGSVQIVLLLSAVATAAVVVAAASAERALRRQAERMGDARRSVSEVVDAARAYYRDQRILPATLGALVSGGYLSAEQTLDPFMVGTALRLVRTGARGTVTCSSRGPNHINERGSGDDVVAVGAAMPVGAALTHEQGTRLARMVEHRVTSTRNATALTASNGALWSSITASRAWLEGNVRDADWPERVARHVDLLVRALGDAAVESGRETPQLAAAIAAIAHDADALVTLVRGGTALRGTVTAAQVASLGLGVGARRLARAGLLWLDDLERAARAGALAEVAWRTRIVDRLAGLEARALAALLEAQDGGSGLRHPLSGYRSINAALTGLGLPLTERLDGFALAWRMEAAPGFGFRSAGADRLVGTGDDTVFAAW